MEVYDLNWREKYFIRLLEKNGFYFNDLTNQIQTKKRDSYIPFLGHITKDKHRGYSGYLIIYDNFEKEHSLHPPAKEAFSKLRKLAENFD